MTAMASIRERRRTDGTVGYCVLWRHAGRQTSLTFDTVLLAEQAQRLIEATGADPDHVTEILLSRADTLPTVADAVMAHVAELTGVTDRTRADYLRDAERHIYPTLGALPVAAVDKTVAADWVNRLDKSELADKTIANQHALLSAALTFAVEKGWATANPCRGMRLPRRDHGDDEMVFLEQDEWELLRSEIPIRWQPLYDFLAGTGCRWGEAVGLDIRNTYPKATPPVVRILEVDRQTPQGRQKGPPKTRRGRRTAVMSQRAADAVLPLTEGRPPDARLFVSRRGGAMPRSHYGQVWQPAVARAQDPERHGDRALRKRPRIHDIRHSYASWMIAQGVDPLALSRQLGHKSITTTYNLYGHLMNEQQLRLYQAATKALGD
jgi:integrase